MQRSVQWPSVFDATGRGGQPTAYLPFRRYGNNAEPVGIADNVTGGQLDIDGQVSEEGGRRTIRGHAEATDYNVVRAPTPTQLLGATSFGGLAGAISGMGIPFSTLRADFTLAGDRLQLGRLVTYGSALGVTATGWFDIARYLSNCRERSRRATR